MDNSMENKLKEFAIDFDRKVMIPLKAAGYDRYNVFDILNIGRQELRHSDFLAFLFDTNKSGNIGEQFLRNFLILYIEKFHDENIDFFELLYEDINSVTVVREAPANGGRIDLLIVAEIGNRQAKKIVIAIENKIDSIEHDNQTERYSVFLEEKYKHCTIIRLFLAPYHIEILNNGWRAIEYDFIYNVLERVSIEKTDERMKILIEDYKDLIWRELTMQTNDETKKAALEIYKNNKEVLDFIFACKPDWVKETARILRRQFEANGAKGRHGGKISDNQNTNICFVIERIEKYAGYYFQLNVSEMCFYFVNSVERNAVPQKLIFGDRQETEKKVTALQDKILDTAVLQEECNLIVEKIFSQNGLIEQSIVELESMVRKGKSN